MDFLSRTWLVAFTAERNQLPVKVRQVQQENGVKAGRCYPKALKGL
ncbi:MAG: hypothetical protein ACOCYD_01405 [bacterium]